MITCIVKRLMESHRLDEMAYNRNEALIICMELGDEVIEHFDKIYKESNKQVVSHWCDEMNAWIRKVLEIKLKPKNRNLTPEQLFDWFFTRGSDLETLFSDLEEREYYSKFIKDVQDTKDAKLSVVNIGLVDERVFNKGNNRRRR